MNYCPCLSKCLSKLFPQKKRKSYEGAKQFQEEEFINPHNEEIRRAQTIPVPIPIPPSHPSQKPIPVNYQEEDELNVKLNLPNPQEEEEEIQKIIERQLRTPVQTPLIQKQSPKALEVNHSENIPEYSESINYDGFNINLDPLDPYYAILSEKTSNLKDLLERQGNQIEVGFPNKAGLTIASLDGTSSSSFILKYRLNCSYSYYLSLLKNERIQSSFCPLVVQAKMLESFKPNLTLNSLKFKKIGSFEARELSYLKYQNGSKREHWQVYLNDESQKEQTAEFKRCDLFSVCNLKERGDSELNVTQYLEVQLRSANVASILPRLVLQFRNYLGNLWDHIEKNYDKELV